MRGGAAYGGLYDGGNRCMPNTKPVNDNAAVDALHHREGRGAGQSGVRVYPVGAVPKGARRRGDGGGRPDEGSRHHRDFLTTASRSPIRTCSGWRCSTPNHFGLFIMSHSEDVRTSSATA